MHLVIVRPLLNRVDRLECELHLVNRTLVEMADQNQAQPISPPDDLVGMPRIRHNAAVLPPSAARRTLPQEPTADEQPELQAARTLMSQIRQLKADISLHGSGPR